MMQHSKLPWAITQTPKGSKQITDARGGVVANLTALDMVNAELIVTSVNTPQPPKKITDFSQLKSYEFYWTIDKNDPTDVGVVYLEFVRPDYAYFDEGTYKHYKDESKNTRDLFGPIRAMTASPVPDSGIRYITNPDDLTVGEKYWLVDKTNDMYRSEICMSIDNDDRQKHFKNRIWATKENPQAFARWNIFGPIPRDVVPDFESLMTKK